MTSVPPRAPASISPTPHIHRPQKPKMLPVINEAIRPQLDKSAANDTTPAQILRRSTWSHTRLCDLGPKGEGSKTKAVATTTTALTNDDVPHILQICEGMVPCIVREEADSSSGPAERSTALSSGPLPCRAGHNCPHLFSFLRPCVDLCTQWILSPPSHPGA